MPDVGQPAPGRAYALARKSGAVGLIYGASVGILLIAEVALSRSVDATTFGEYQYVRQMLPLIVAMGLFGVDQALTRRLVTDNSVELFNPTLRASVVAGAAIAIPVAVGSAHFYSLSMNAALVLALAPIFLVGSELSAAALRAERRYAAAAIAQQGYRLGSGLMLLGAVAIGISGSIASLLLLFASILVGSWVTPLCLARYRSTRRAAKEDVRRLRILGAGFGLSMLSMAAADWADQAAVAYSFGTLAESGSYVAVKLVTVYPFVTAASILGFIALPEALKRKERLNPATWRAISMVTIGATTLLWAAASTIFIQVTPTILGRPLEPLPLCLLSAVGALRIAYLVPSSVIGAVGSVRQLSIGGIVGLAAVAAEVLAVITASTNDAVLAGAVGLLVATTIRIAASFVLAGAAVRSWNGTQRDLATAQPSSPHEVR